MKAYKFVIIAVAIFVGGLLLGISINISVQEPKPEQTQLAIILGIVGAIAEGIATLQFLMNMFNKPKFKIGYRIWDRDHPLHSELSNIQVLTLRVENTGGGQVAEGCSAHINIDGIINYEDALNWLYRGRNNLFATPYTLPTEQVRTSVVRDKYIQNYDVPIKKGSSSAEYVDILFTKEDDNIVWLLDAERTRLEFGREYKTKITIEVKDMSPKKVNCKVEIPSWNNIQVTDFIVV